MIVKNLTKPVALRVYDSLNVRTTLTASERKERLYRLRGYEGEEQLSTDLKQLPFDCLVICDLALQDNGTSAQIDAVVLTGNCIYLYEAKNYTGSYVYRDDAFHGFGDFKIVNPLVQPNKSNPLLHNLLRKLGYRFEVKSHVVFMNPAFYLYELPRDRPFLFVNQLPEHFRQLEKQQPFVGKQHKRLAQQLCDLHVDDIRPTNLPHYEYAQLKKGVYCPECSSFEHTNTRKNRICSQCGYKEPIAKALKRTAEEFFLLFPGKFLTKKIMCEWSGGEYDEQRIQKMLGANFILHGQHRNSFYAAKTEKKPILIE